MTKPHLGQKKRILLHQPVNSHCTRERGVRTLEPTRDHTSGSFILHPPGLGTNHGVWRASSIPHLTPPSHLTSPQIGFLLTFMPGLAGTSVGLETLGQSEAIIRNISTGRMKILRLAAIKPSAPRLSKFQNCGTWKGAGFFVLPLFWPKAIQTFYWILKSAFSMKAGGEIKPVDSWFSLLVREKRGGWWWFISFPS